MNRTRAGWGIVLAAGGSSRMGRPKALLDLDGQPLIAAHLAALAPSCERLRVVLGAHREAIEAALPAGVERAFNPDWARTGMRESLAIALEGLEAEAVALVTPVDAPPAPARVIEALLAAGAPAVPCYENCDTHPVLIRVGDCRAALATGTLRDALLGAARVPVDWADGALNLNTPEEWARWRRR